MRFAYTQPNGIAAIVISAPREHIQEFIGKKDAAGLSIPITDDEMRQYILKKSIPVDATNVHELPDDWVAPDRTHRHAWVTDGKTVTIDQAKIIKSK